MSLFKKNKKPYYPSIHGHGKKPKKKKKGLRRKIARLGLMLGAGTVVAGGGAYWNSESTKSTVFATVTKVEKLVDKNCSESFGNAAAAPKNAAPPAMTCETKMTGYRIHTTHGTFDNTTSLFQGKGQASVEKLQRSFENAVGQSYYITYNGRDIAQIGMSRNILSAERAGKYFDPSIYNTIYSQKRSPMSPMEEVILAREVVGAVHGVPVPPPFAVMGMR